MCSSDLLVFLFALVLCAACAGPRPTGDIAASVNPVPSPSPTEEPYTPTPFPTLEPASPGSLLIPAYVYDDGTSIIDGPVALDGVMFDLNGADVFELCLTRGYECVAYEDIIPIRLVGIDAPEPGVECYGDMAELVLSELLLEGMPVDVVTDPNLPEEDADGILQAWVWNSAVLVNLEMVKRGAAVPTNPESSIGAFDEALRSAAKRAKALGLGLWGECGR